MHNFFRLLFFCNRLRFYFILNFRMFCICNRSFFNWGFLYVTHILSRNNLNFWYFDWTFSWFEILICLFMSYCFLFLRWSSRALYFAWLHLLMILRYFSFFLLLLYLNIIFFNLSSSLALNRILVLCLRVSLDFGLFYLCLLLL
jgi:hypothetical protein